MSKGNAGMIMAGLFGLLILVISFPFLSEKVNDFTKSTPVTQELLSDGNDTLRLSNYPIKEGSFSLKTELGSYTNNYTIDYALGWLNVSTQEAGTYNASYEFISEDYISNKSANQILSVLTIFLAIAGLGMIIMLFI